MTVTAERSRLDRLLDYDRWANHQTARALIDLEDEATGRETPVRPMAIFGHLLAAHRIWQTRIQGQPVTQALWPSPRLEAFIGDIDAIRSAWHEVLADRSEGEFVRYRNSRNVAFGSRVDDIVMHVILHGNYHRGQIAMLLGRENVTPPAMDFIFAVRSGAIAEDISEDEA